MYIIKAGHECVYEYECVYIFAGVYLRERLAEVAEQMYEIYRFNGAIVIQVEHLEVLHGLFFGARPTELRALRDDVVKNLKIEATW